MRFRANQNNFVPQPAKCRRCSADIPHVRKRNASLRDKFNIALYCSDECMDKYREEVKAGAPARVAAYLAKRGK